MNAYITFFGKYLTYFYSYVMLQEEEIGVQGTG